MKMSRVSESGPLVLRTVYLPQRDDERLRGYGFRTNRSKNDLIREAVTASLDKWEREELEAAQRMEAAAAAAAAATAEDVQPRTTAARRVSGQGYAG
jgi:Arc/MetJ-type ribon-helix-helix transcriptional regulator